MIISKLQNDKFVALRFLRVLHGNARAYNL